MDLDIGDMGYMDSLGLSLAPPAPLMDSPESAEAMASSASMAAAFAMTDQTEVASPSMLGIMEGSSSPFGGEMSAMAFEAPTLGSIPGLEIPSPGVIGDVSTPEALPSSGPGTYATTEFPDMPSITPSDEGYAAALGGLPGMDVPSPQPVDFRPTSSSLDELVDLQLSISPPEPAALDLALAPDAPSVQAQSASVSPSVGEYSASQLKMMEHGALQAFGPLGSSFDSAGSAGRSGGAQAVYQIQNLNLPGVKAQGALEELLALSTTGTDFDLRGLEA